MTPQPEDENLLNEVLAEGESGNSDDVLLSDLLSHARRRRRRRTVARVGGALVATVIVLFSVRLRHVAPAVLLKSPPVSVQIVSTQPLSDRDIVQTSAFSADRIVASRAIAATVTTKSGVGFTVIDDAQLLALIAPREAALVRVKPGVAQLIFVNPQDEYGFPVN